MRLLQVKLIKETILLALPISLFNLTTVLIGIANGLMLAKLGSTALAAGAIIGITQISLMMIFSSPLFAISSIISRMLAENKIFQIGAVIQQGCVLALLLSIPAILAMLFIKPILLLFGQPEQVVNFVGLYFKSYWWGVPTAMLLTCVQQFMLGLKKTRLVTLIGAASLIISVFFGYILAFGKMGIAPQGVFGLGCAQVLRSAIILITLFLFLVLNKEFSIFGLYAKRSINKFLELKQIFKLGWPISIHAASEYLAMFSITLMIGRLGQTELIAQQIATQYVQLLSIAMLSLSQASNLLVSNSVGKQDWKSMQNYGYQGLLLSIFIGFIAILCFAFFTKTLVSPYISVTEKIDLLPILKLFLFITMMGQLLMAIKTVSVGILRALYDTKIPMIISVICGWGITVPFGYISTYFFEFGINGIAMVQTISFGFCAFMLYDRWRVLSFNISKQPSIKTAVSYQIWAWIIEQFRYKNKSVINESKLH